MPKKRGGRLNSTEGSNALLKPAISNQWQPVMFYISTLITEFTQVRFFHLIWQDDSALTSPERKKRDAFGARLKPDVRIFARRTAPGVPARRLGSPAGRQSEGITKCHGVDMSNVLKSPFRPLMPLPERIAQIRGENMPAAERDPLFQRRMAMFERVCATLDGVKFAALQEKYRSELVEFDTVGHLKYFDLPYWIWHKTDLAVALDIDVNQPGTILDLGVGAGHFPAICQAYGNKVVGLDIENIVYDDLCQFLRVERINQRIVARQPLGGLDLKFNLVTAIWISFDSKGVDAQNRRTYWDNHDWKFFFDDLKTHARKNFKIYLELNQQIFHDGTSGFDEHFVHACVASGATLETPLGTRKITFDLRQDFAFKP